MQNITVHVQYMQQAHFVDGEADVVERGQRVRQQLATGALEQLDQEAAHLRALLRRLVHVGLVQREPELRVLPVRLCNT